jgi:hypothetical protein
MPVDPPQLPRPRSLVIKDINEVNILDIKNISKENVLFRMLVWTIIKLMS